MIAVKHHDHPKLPFASGKTSISTAAVKEGRQNTAYVETDVVAALFGGRRRAITVDDRDVKPLVLVEFQHRARKNGVDAAIGLPPPEGTIDAGVMDLETTFAIPVDRQFLPLATQIEELQHIVEDLQQTQLRRRPTPADGKMR